MSYSSQGFLQNKKTILVQRGILDGNPLDVELSSESRINYRDGVNDLKDTNYIHDTNISDHKVEDTIIESKNTARDLHQTTTPNEDIYENREDESQNFNPYASLKVGNYQAIKLRDQSLGIDMDPLQDIHIEGLGLQQEKPLTSKTNTRSVKQQ